MRFVALVLIISLTSCTIVGGVIGGVSASNHNASRPHPQHEEFHERDDARDDPNAAREHAARYPQLEVNARCNAST
jgi:hypothetical protein